MSAWLQNYHLSEYAPALRDEGYDVHPGFLCAVPELEVGQLCEALFWTCLAA